MPVSAGAHPVHSLWLCEGVVVEVLGNRALHVGFTSTGRKRHRRKQYQYYIRFIHAPHQHNKWVNAICLTPINHHTQASTTTPTTLLQSSPTSLSSSSSSSSSSSLHTHSHSLITKQGLTV